MSLDFCGREGTTQISMLPTNYRYGGMESVKIMLHLAAAI
jgi:hypothetical protein